MTFLKLQNDQIISADQIVRCWVFKDDVGWRCAISMTRGDDVVFECRSEEDAAAIRDELGVKLQAI